uniref:Uncharacterized protein n=1 Tax=Alexandrium monilatum TaxID=311494 RepID=A0A7S4Q0M5_9DINO
MFRTGSPPRAHCLALAASLHAPESSTPRAGSLDPLLQAQLSNLTESLRSLLRSDKHPTASWEPATSLLGFPTAPAQPPAPPLAPPLVSPLDFQEVAPASEPDSCSGTCCSRHCYVLTRQREALAQSLAGLAARAFNWSAGMSKVLRRDLAEIIVEYISPCVALHPDLREVVTELERTEWAGARPTPPARAPPPEPLLPRPSLRDLGYGWPLLDGEKPDKPDPLLDRPFEPGRRSSAIWEWWDSDMGSFHDQLCPVCGSCGGPAPSDSKSAEAKGTDLSGPAVRGSSEGPPPSDSRHVDLLQPAATAASRPPANSSPSPDARPRPSVNSSPSPDRPEGHPAPAEPWTRKVPEIEYVDTAVHIPVQRHRQHVSTATTVQKPVEAGSARAGRRGSAAGDGDAWDRVASVMVHPAAANGHAPPRLLFQGQAPMNELLAQASCSSASASDSASNSASGSSGDEGVVRKRSSEKRQPKRRS